MANKYRIQYTYVPNNITGEILTERPTGTTEVLPEVKEAFAQWIKLLESNNNWDLTGTNLTGTYAHSTDGTTWITDATIHLDNDFLIEFSYTGSDEIVYTHNCEYLDIEPREILDIFHSIERNYSDVAIVGVSHS